MEDNAIVLALKDKLTRLRWVEAQAELTRIRQSGTIDPENFNHLVRWVAFYHLMCSEDYRSI